MPEDWPMAENYSQMIQNPSVAFKDADLQKCNIQRDDNNQPFGRSGAFAVVYKATLASGQNVAVRAFTSANAERTERYTAISEYLDQKRSSVKSLVGFKYHEKGIRAANRQGRSKMYPMLTMDWVSGEDLYRYVRTQSLDKNKTALRKLADRWVDMNEDLCNAQIAHGDLQHGNVLVNEKHELMLVDYDCMCVPKLVGRLNMEIGVEPYQHPHRNSETPLSPRLDGFSAIFIFLALRALAADTGLWRKYIEQDQYDKLLFRKRDFEEPTDSQLYRDLLKSPDSDVPRIAKHLFELYRVKIEEVPPLQDVLFSWDTVRSLFTQQQFDAAVKILERLPANKTIPPDLQGKAADAKARVKCLALLEAKVKAGDEAGMQQHYDPKLLLNFPAAAEAVKVAQHATKVIGILDLLKRAIQNRKYRELVATWDANQQLLVTRVSSKAYQPEVEIWRTRNRACDEFLNAFKKSPGDPAEVTKLWKALQAAGGHPEADSQRTTIEQRLERDRAWHSFCQVPKNLSEANDRQLVKLWVDLLFKDWDVAERERQRVNQAGARLSVLQQLQQLITPAPPTADSERKIRDVCAGLPAAYEFPQRARVAEAVERLKVVEALSQALKDPVTEANIVAAAQQCKAKQALSMLDATVVQRVKLAEQRVPLLNGLKQVSLQLPLEQLDPIILARWKDDILKDCLEARPWQPAYQAAVVRKQVITKLQIAVESHDQVAIATLVAEPCLRGYQLPRDWSNSIADAQQRVERGRQLSDSLASGNRELFFRSFDQALIKDSAAVIAVHEQTVIAWMKEGILQVDKLGLKKNFATNSLNRIVSKPNSFQAKWTWPQVRFTQQCVITVSRQKPKADQTPETINAVFQQPVTREQYMAAAQYVLHAREGWSGFYVTVWAIIDLGFTRLTSEPLVLDRLEIGSAQGNSSQPQKKSFWGL